MYKNSNGQAFISPKMLKGEYAKKNVKFFVGVYQGFGIQADLYENEIEPNKAGIDFIVKNPLVDYRANREVCDSGIYRISIEDFRKYAKKDCLNEKHGYQYFISAHRCEKVG